MFVCVCLLLLEFYCTFQLAGYVVQGQTLGCLKIASSTLSALCEHQSPQAGTAAISVSTVKLARRYHENIQIST